MIDERTITWEEAIKEIECLRAEVERLRALLKEAGQYVNDAGGDEDPETQTLSHDLLGRISAALEQ